jgi:hypothetical protein
LSKVFITQIGLHISSKGNTRKEASNELLHENHHVFLGSFRIHRFFLAFQPGEKPMSIRSLSTKKRSFFQGVK